MSELITGVSYMNDIDSRFTVCQEFEAMSCTSSISEVPLPIKFHAHFFGLTIMIIYQSHSQPEVVSIDCYGVRLILTCVIKIIW